MPSRKLRPDILTSEQALEQVDPPWSDPENDVEAVQDGRIYIELMHATPADYSAGLKRAIERGWLVLHDSGTYIGFTQAGANLFASCMTIPRGKSDDRRIRKMESGSGLLR